MGDDEGEEGREERKGEYYRPHVFDAEADPVLH